MTELKKTTTWSIRPGSYGFIEIGNSEARVETKQEEKKRFHDSELFTVARCLCARKKKSCRCVSRTRVTAATENSFEPVAPVQFVSLPITCLLRLIARGAERSISSFLYSFLPLIPPLVIVRSRHLVNQTRLSYTNPENKKQANKYYAANQFANC